MIYTASFKAVSVSAIQDLFEILAPSDAVLEILGIEISQEDLTAVEQLQVDLLMVSGAPTSGSGGSTVTPRPLKLGWPAAGSTVEANNTTQLSGGTIVDMYPGYWDVLNPYLWKPTPKEQIWISPSTRLVVELPVAPSGASNMSGHVVFEEHGG